MRPTRPACSCRRGRGCRRRRRPRSSASCTRSGPSCGMLAMRRTLFLVPVADVAHGPRGRLAGGRRDRARADHRDVHRRGGIGPDPAGLLEELEQAGLAAVRERGEASTAELRALDPRLGLKMTLGRGKSYEATMSICAEVFSTSPSTAGSAGAGGPLGTWIGSQFRWSPIERWLPDGIPDGPRRGRSARADLVSGAGSGPSARHPDRRQVVDRLDAGRDEEGAGRSRRGRGGPGRRPDRLRAARRPRDRPIRPSRGSRFLPALDATTMGWKERDWYLGPHQPQLFDHNGNAGPTIWIGGRARRRLGAAGADGEIAVRLLEDVAPDARGGDRSGSGAPRRLDRPREHQVELSHPLETI